MSASRPERRVIAIVGATATGKTAVAEVVAARLGAEVVCVDSRQVFRDLEIGTGKPAPAERAALPHHLFDALDLTDTPSAGWYARAAAAAAGGVHARGRPVVLVGGTGLYLRALRSGLAPHPPRSPAVRAGIEERLARSGVAAMHAELAIADPETAARLGPRDAQRIVRALEVLESTGRPLSWWHGGGRHPALVADWHVFEMVATTESVAQRIALRTREMLDLGLVDEARALVGRGLLGPLRALRAIGYDEALDVIEGRSTREEAEAAINRRTRQLAKRQRTWFRHQVEAERLPASAVPGGPAAAVLRRVAVAGAG